MPKHRFWAFVLVCGALALPPPPPAHAADATDSCDFFINSAPTVISSPGTYCLTADLATSDPSYAIFAGGDITIDCLGHVIDGSGAGAASSARGIFTSENNRLTVRNCHIRGFAYGISLEGVGNVIEDNLIEHTLVSGIGISGNNNVIRRNRVAEIGGSSIIGDATGIYVSGTAVIVDNDVAGIDQVVGIPGSNVGIASFGTSGATIAGNRIRGIGVGNSQSFGIQAGGDVHQRMSIRDNDIVGEGGAGSVGISCSGANQRARGNTISGFLVGINNCANSVGNVVRP